MCVCVCVCVCVCERERERERELYNIMAISFIIIFEVLMYTLLLIL